MFGFMRGMYFCVLITIITPVALEAGDKPFIISTNYKSLLSNPEQTGMLDRLTQEAFRRLGYLPRLSLIPPSGLWWLSMRDCWMGN